MNDPFSTPTKTNSKLDRAFKDVRLSDAKCTVAEENAKNAEQKLREELKEKAMLSAQKKQAIRKWALTKEEADAQFRREVKCAQRIHAKALRKADQDRDVEVSYIDSQILAKDRDINKAGKHLENCRDEVQYTRRRQTKANANLIVANGGTKKAASIMTVRPLFSDSPTQSCKKSSMIDPIEPTKTASSIVTTPTTTEESPPPPQQQKPTMTSSSSSSSPGDLSSLTVPVLKGMLKERGLKVSGKKSDLIERLQSNATRQAQRKNDEPPTSEIIEISSDDSSIDSFIALSSDGNSVDFE